MVELSRVLDKTIGVRGEIRDIVFKEAEYLINCLVPDDDMWGAVKDNLILREYDRAGIDISACHGVVVDAGAHVGLFTLRAAIHAKRVIAVEPHPRNFLLLDHNVRRSRLKASVELLPNALWSSADHVHLSEGSHSGGGSLLRDSGHRHEVNGVTLEEIMVGTESADLLKLDIEGAEFDVLESSSNETLRKFRAIVGEIHPNGMKDEGIIVNRLRSAGFEVTMLEPPSEEPGKSLWQVLRNWTQLRGCTRLKLVLALSYAAARLVGELPAVQAKRKAERLKFVYAVRSS